MIERLYIDGRDAYTTYGVFVSEGGYNDLLALPALKATPANDWPEEDGTELDLSDPKLESREATIKFSSRGNAGSEALIERLSKEAYHTFEFKSIGRSYTLRLVSQPALDRDERMETFSLRLANDFPLPEGYRYEAPRSEIPAQSGYELDERPLADYGVSILKGSGAEIRKSPAVKKNLQHNLNSHHGAQYDPGAVLFQPKEVKLRCLMRARDLAEFWRNYDALLCDLTRPGERQLYVDDTGYEYPCCYKNCSVARFEPADRIWMEFDLNLTFTSFRVEREVYVLGTERSEVILTENEFAIDLVD